MKGNIDEEFALQRRVELGQFLRQKREEKRLTQAQLGDLMGFNSTNISKIEAGKWNMSIDILTLFALHLGFEWPPAISKESPDPSELS